MLKKKLAEEEDSALCLHLVLVLLFHQQTGSMIHISGKFVPTLIQFLSSHIPDKVREQLVACQHVISKHWKLSRAASADVDNESQPSGDADSASATDPDETQSEVQLLELQEACGETTEVDDVETELIILIQELKHLVM